MNAVVEAASAFAADGKRETLNLRFAELDNRRYLFLADDECRVIEIDTKGWRECADPPVIFRAGDGLPLPMPAEGSVDDLLEFLNIDRENMAFVLAWMINALYFPGGQSPILLLNGPAGSGKTSALSSIVRLLDPKVGAVVGLPKKEDDLFVSAYGGAIVSFDNASTLARLSDSLCRLSTGGGLRKRKLYTDTEVNALDAKRPVIIAGIDPTMYQQDLLERVVRVELQKPETYLNDAQVEARFKEQRGRLTGAVLTMLSRVMSRVSTGDEGKFRFGTYAMLGEAVAQELDFEAGWFTSEYRSRFEENSREAANSDAVFTYINHMVAGIDSGKTREVKLAHELWKQMQEWIKSDQITVPRDDVPRNARSMSSRITRIQDALERDHGIRVSRGSNRKFIFEWDEGSGEALMEELEKHKPPF